MIFFKNYLFLSLWILLITGCQTKWEKRTQQDLKMVRINFTYNPLTLDPRKSTDPISNTLHLMLYEGLTHLEPDGSLSLALANSIDRSQNDLVYTFHLKKTYWSNGQELTAYHFQNSWKELLSPDFPSLASHLLFPIKNAEKAKKGLCSIEEVGIKAFDDATLIVELEKPTPYFLELTAFPTYFPLPHQNQDIDFSKNKPADLVSNGPFKLTLWKNEDEILAEKNPYFWNEQAMKIDCIYTTIISDERTALQLFEKGNLDWLGGLISPLPIDAISHLNQANKLKIHPIAGTNFSAFNTKQYPFNNLHIRRAFAYAINRQIIIDNVIQMFDLIATGPVPSIFKDVQEKKFFIDGNIEEAKKEFEIGLQELGISKKDFPPVTYSYFSSELQQKLALSLQSQWKQILGVEVKLESKELKIFLNQLRQSKFMFAQMSWIAQFYDRMTFLERFIKADTFRNYSSWENLTYQELISRSFNAANKSERNQILEEAESILIDEMPIAPLYHYNVLYLKNPQLKNIQISPLGHVDFRYSNIDRSM